MKVSLIEKINGGQIRETIQFSDGASFFCPKPRSTMMIFKCGPKNKLTNVYEFSPCVYKFFVDVECPEVSFFLIFSVKAKLKFFLKLLSK